MAVTGGRVGIYRCTAQGDKVTKNMKITYVRWIGATTAGHQCIVKDLGGEEIFPSQADGANFTDIQYIGRWFDGFEVTTKGSGTVYVFTE